MLSRESARWLFRCLLAREPEPAAAEWLSSSFVDLETARAFLLRSEEFRDQWSGLVDLTPEIDALVRHQLAPWLGRSVDHQRLREEAHRRNDYRNYVFEIEGTSVVMWPKDKDHPQYQGRAECYRQHLEEVVRGRPLPSPILLILDVDDLAHPSDVVPVFGYQREPRSSVLCFPDIEFLTYDFYEAKPEPDAIAYADKAIRAGFIGSTSGLPYLHTEKTMAADLIGRLSSAVFFKPYDQVDFRITNIVQTDGPATDEKIKALGVVSDMAPLSALFANRFILSMDGNGATCSRVVVSLKSNSVLLKYDSEYSLFYTPALKPWRDYVPISKDSDVLNIIREEERSPGVFSPVAASGARFAASLLTRSACLEYSWRLLKRYADLFEPPA